MEGLMGWAEARTTTERLYTPALDVEATRARDIIGVFVWVYVTAIA
jgi:hypothetical protein